MRDRVNRRAYEVLSDSKWHDLEGLIRDLMRFVPPGIAIRRHARMYKHSMETSGGGGKPRSRLDDQGKIRVGARNIVRESLMSSVAYEVDGPKIRLIGTPNVVRGDMGRAVILQPVMDALVATFEAVNLTWAAEQVRIRAHEEGFHLDSCPPGDSLFPPSGGEVTTE